jgi:hypothetical protein
MRRTERRERVEARKRGYKRAWSSDRIGGRGAGSGNPVQISKSRKIEAHRLKPMLPNRKKPESAGRSACATLADRNCCGGFRQLKLHQK